MNYARLESRVCLDEGYKSMPYLDTVGVPTIGYGTTAILGEPVTMDHPAITESVARQILRQDLYAACMDAQSLIGRFDDLDQVRQEVMANMAYNLGKTRLSGFIKLLAALNNLDYEAAAREMESSKWYEQVKVRAWRLAAAMRAGEWS